MRTAARPLSGAAAECPDESAREIERIRRAYAEYDVDPRARERWNADNPGNRWARLELDTNVKQMLGRVGLLPLTHARILDMGCGYGDELVQLTRLGAKAANLHGIDLLPDRIERALSAKPEVHFRVASAEHSGYPDSSFDLVMQFKMFSSVLSDRMSAAIAREIDRVLRPGGYVLWYDLRYPNPWNPQVRPQGRGEIASYFPDYCGEIRSTTLLPPIARRLKAGMIGLYRWLALAPVLRSHYLALLRKPANTATA